MSCGTVKSETIGDEEKEGKEVKERDDEEAAEEMAEEEKEN